MILSNIVSYGCRAKFYFKCLDELPPGTYKKTNVECRRKGILKCDWFNKIIDKVIQQLHSLR